MLNLAVVDDNFDLPEQQETFIIDSDQKAEWALNRIAKNRRECDRFVSVARLEIERLTALISDENKRCDTNNA